MLETLCSTLPAACIHGGYHWYRCGLYASPMLCREAPIRAKQAVARYKNELADAKASILNQNRDVEVRRLAVLLILNHIIMGSPSLCHMAHIPMGHLHVPEMCNVSPIECRAYSGNKGSTCFSCTGTAQICWSAFTHEEGLGMHTPQSSEEALVHCVSLIQYPLSKPVDQIELQTFYGSPSPCSVSGFLCPDL